MLEKKFICIISTAIDTCCEILSCTSVYLKYSYVSYKISHLLFKFFSCPVDGSLLVYKLFSVPSWSTVSINSFQDLVLGKSAMRVNVASTVILTHGIPAPKSEKQRSKRTGILNVTSVSLHLLHLSTLRCQQRLFRKVCPTL